MRREALPRNFSEASGRKHRAASGSLLRDYRAHVFGADPFSRGLRLGSSVSSHCAVTRGNAKPKAASNWRRTQLLSVHVTQPQEFHKLRPLVLPIASSRTAIPPL